MNNISLILGWLLVISMVVHMYVIYKYYFETNNEVYKGPPPKLLNAVKDVTNIATCCSLACYSPTLDKTIIIDYTEKDSFVYDGLDGVVQDTNIKLNQIAIIRDVGVFNANSVKFNRLCWGGGRFIYINYDTVYLSTDGVEWIKYPGKIVPLINIVWIDHLNVFVGRNSYHKTRVSENGFTWTDTTSTPATYDMNIYYNKSTKEIMTTSKTDVSLTNNLVDYTTISCGVNSDNPSTSLIHPNGMMCHFVNAKYLQLIESGKRIYKTITTNNAMPTCGTWVSALNTFVTFNNLYMSTSTNCITWVNKTLLNTYNKCLDINRNGVLVTTPEGGIDFIKL